MRLDVRRTTQAGAVRPDDVVFLNGSHLTVEKVSILRDNKVELSGMLQQFGVKVGPPVEHVVTMNSGATVVVLPTLGHELSLWGELGKMIDLARAEWAERHEDDDTPPAAPWNRGGNGTYEIRGGTGHWFTLDLVRPAEDE